MPRKSDILKLPEEVLAYLNQCLDDPKLNLDETTELVNELIRDKYLDENEVTRSSLGRYAKKRRENFDAAVERMAQMKAQREEFYARFGDDNLDTAGRYAMEMLMPVVMEMTGALNLVKDATPAEAFAHSKTIKNLAGSIATIEKALTESKSRNDAIKKQAAEEERARGAERVAEIAKARGQTPEQVEFWRKDFLAGRR